MERGNEMYDWIDWINKSTQHFLDLPIANRNRKWNNDAAEKRVRRYAKKDDGDMDWNKYYKAFFIGTVINQMNLVHTNCSMQM